MATLHSAVVFTGLNTMPNLKKSLCYCLQWPFTLFWPCTALHWTNQIIEFHLSFSKMFILLQWNSHSKLRLQRICPFLTTENRQKQSPSFSAQLLDTFSAQTMTYCRLEKNAASQSPSSSICRWDINKLTVAFPSETYHLCKVDLSRTLESTETLWSRNKNNPPRPNSPEFDDCV